MKNTSLIALNRASKMRLALYSKISKREFQRRAFQYGAANEHAAKDYTIIEQNAFAWQDGYKAARIDLRRAIESAGVAEVLTSREVDLFLSMLRPIR